MHVVIVVNHSRIRRTHGGFGEPLRGRQPVASDIFRYGGKILPEVSDSELTTVDLLCFQVFRRQ